MSVDEGTWLAVGFSYSGGMVAFHQANFTPALAACAAADFAVNVSSTCEDGASRAVSISYAEPSDALRQCFGALPATDRVPCEHAPLSKPRWHGSAIDHAPGCSGQPQPTSRLRSVGRGHIGLAFDIGTCRGPRPSPASSSSPRRSQSASSSLWRRHCTPSARKTPCASPHHTPLPLPHIPPRLCPYHAPTRSTQVRFAQPMLSSLLVGGAVALDLTIFTLPGEAGGGTWYAT